MIISVLHHSEDYLTIGIKSESDAAEVRVFLYSFTDIEQPDLLCLRNHGNLVDFHVCELINHFSA